VIPKQTLNITYVQPCVHNLMTLASAMSEVLLGSQKLEMGHVTLTKPLSGVLLLLLLKMYLFK